MLYSPKYLDMDEIQERMERAIEILVDIRVGEVSATMSCIDEYGPEVAYFRALTKFKDPYHTYE